MCYICSNNSTIGGQVEKNALKVKILTLLNYLITVDP